LRIEDVEVGSKLEGMIEKVIDRGVIVRLAEGITGWVPVEQSADVLSGTSKKSTGKELTGWEKRFKEGTKIKCKVYFSKNEANHRS
jgi:ribosomal protein S1